MSSSHRSSSSTIVTCIQGLQGRLSVRYACAAWSALVDARVSIAAASGAVFDAGAASGRHPSRCDVERPANGGVSTGEQKLSSSGRDPVRADVMSGGAPSFASCSRMWLPNASEAKGCRSGRRDALLAPWLANLGCTDLESLVDLAGMPSNDRAAACARVLLLGSVAADGVVWLDPLSPIVTGVSLSLEFGLRFSLLKSLDRLLASIKRNNARWRSVSAQAPARGERGRATFRTNSHRNNLSIATKHVANTSNAIDRKGQQ